MGRGREMINGREGRRDGAGGERRGGRNEVEGGGKGEVRGEMWTVAIAGGSLVGPRLAVAWSCSRECE